LEYVHLRRERQAEHSSARVVERVESLSMPLGAEDSMLRLGQRPRSTLEARLFATRASRELGQNYRLWYELDLWTNAAAIEAMQRHLWMRFGDSTPYGDPLDEWELRRHGALLSEILARSLGAEWLDVAPSEPGYWAMLVPPGLLIRPIGRVFRFATLWEKERDLLGYYGEIVRRTRAPAQDG
jgi:hypothetical protein